MLDVSYSLTLTLNFIVIHGKIHQVQQILGRSYAIIIILIIVMISDQIFTISVVKASIPSHFCWGESRNNFPLQWLTLTKCFFKPPFFIMTDHSRESCKPCCYSYLERHVLLATVIEYKQAEKGLNLLQRFSTKGLDDGFPSSLNNF